MLNHMRLKNPHGWNHESWYRYRSLGSFLWRLMSQKGCFLKGTNTLFEVNREICSFSSGWFLFLWWFYLWITELYQLCLVYAPPPAVSPGGSVVTVVRPLVALTPWANILAVKHIKSAGRRRAPWRCVNTLANCRNVLQKVDAVSASRQSQRRTPRRRSSLTSDLSDRGETSRWDVALWRMEPQTSKWKLASPSEKLHLDDVTGHDCFHPFK